MPGPSEIVANLAATAAAADRVAMLWHAALLLAALALAGGFSPSRRTAARLVALLPGSAAAVAVLNGSPFNAIVLGLLTVLLFVLAQGSGVEPVAPAPLIAVVPGLCLFAAGAFYPEFVEGSRWRVLFAAPVGVLPCPTLYAALGLAVMASLGGRAWADTLATGALFYGVFGVFRLGVHLDLGLIAGAVLLVALRLVYRREPDETGGRSWRWKTSLRPSRSRR